MKTILFCLLLLAPAPGRAAAQVIPGIPNDKYYHFTGSYLAAEFAQSLALSVGRSKTQACWIAQGTVLALGVTKELIDASQPGNRFDVQDLAAGLAGGGLQFVFNFHF